MIPDRLFTAHLKVFNMANLFDRPMGIAQSVSAGHGF